MKTIREIKQELQNADVSSRESLLEQYRADTRSGVAALVRNMSEKRRNWNRKNSELRL